MAAGHGTALLHLLVLLLGFSHLLSMNAVPLTRTTSLMHGAHIQVSDNTHLEILEKRWDTGESMKRRMIVEVNDYPGSGANNRHTPKPQVGRVCVDC